MQGALPWAIVGAQSTEAAVVVRLGVGCQLQVMEVQHVFSAMSRPRHGHQLWVMMMCLLVSNQE